MSSIRAVAAALACAGIACSGEKKPEATAGQRAVAVATPRANLSLACAGGTFSKFRLKNTKARSYEPDSFSGQRCTLTDKADGVIWVATGEGHALQDAEKKLSFKDERGRPLEHTCWTSSGTISGVTHTQLILFGPADSRSIAVCCGAACADAQIEMGP